MSACASVNEHAIELQMNEVCNCGMSAQYDSTQPDQLSSEGRSKIQPTGSYERGLKQQAFEKSSILKEHTTQQSLSANQNQDSSKNFEALL